MIAMTLAAMAAAIGGTLDGADAAFSGVGTDTRTLAPGELFVALRGPHHDGHDWLPAARAAGAAGALVERPAGGILPAVRVPDTRAGLGALAAHWRARHPVPLVAVTGSNGKTTVKEMVRAILAGAGPVLATRGNLNNDIGVPLTLLQLGPEHRHAVVEMGANHVGEIDGLTRLARPAVAAITQCAPAHLEGFGNVEAVARAKGEIYNGLAADGVAVLNGDDPYAPLWAQMNAERRCLTFGFAAAADVRAFDLGPDPAVGRRLRIEAGATTIDVALALLGRHNVANAAAAAACALALGIDADTIRAGLQAVRPVSGRLQLKPAACGARILDDSYNANPASLAAALAALGELPGRHWLALGDMAELGMQAAAFHREAGLAARAAGCERLVAVGELAGTAVAAFGHGGLHCTDAEAAGAALRADLAAGVTVLVKGSRSARMERVVAALAAPEATPC